MNIIFSDKANMFDAGIFAILNKKKDELLQQGRTIYNLSVGTPDFKTASHIINAVSQAAREPENFRYVSDMH